MNRCPKSLLTYFLISMFGMGSWIAINGIWAEIAVLVIVCPECYNLPAVVVGIIQLANVGPLLFTIAKYFFHRSKWNAYLFHFEIGVIISLIGIGILSCTLLSIFWDKNAAVFGGIHSVALLVLIMFLALVDCTSSVTFIPFMKHFPEVYLSALYIGEGMSGVLPTIVSLAQGSVRDNIKCNQSYNGYKELGLRFSPSVYFLFLMAMMILCGISFLCIIFLPAVRKHMLNGTIRIGNDDKDRDENYNDVHVGSDSDLAKRKDSEQRSEEYDKKRCLSFHQRPSHVQANRGDFAATSSLPNGSLHHQRRSLSYVGIMKILYSNAVLYICLGILSFLSNGALPAISSFAFIPYGNSVYHVGIDLALLATPLMSAFFHFFPSKSKVITVMITAIACILGIYILDMAIMNPMPLLKTQLIGKVLIVSYVLCYNGGLS